MKGFCIQISMFFFFLMGFNSIGLTQFKSRINININDIIFKKGNLIVNYEIGNAKTNDEIRVWIDVFNSKKDTIYAKSWSGDINKNLIGGGEKVAIWNVFNDRIEFIDSITVKISATVEGGFYLDDPVILSTIYPGWGDYKIKPKGAYWLYGALGYSLIGASIGTYYSASNNYQNYINANSIEDKDSFYGKATLNKNLTYAFLGAAGVVWILDYVGIFNRKKEIKKSWKKALPMKENPNIPSFKIHSAISKSVIVNTSLTALQLVEGSLKYVDLDENNCLDAFEQGYIEFKLLNYGPARAVNFYAKIDNISPNESIGFPDSIKIGNIAVNEERLVRFPIKASGIIKNGSIDLRLKVSAFLNIAVPTFNLKITTCEFNYQKQIAENELKSDIDLSIPVVPARGKERFALIIGNEGYANELTGLSKNFNVPFARHDAIIFKKYAMNVLGIKESNIIFLTDASKKEMYESILTISDQVEKVKDGAELVFYYSGQGLSDTNTLAPYLMPVDVLPTDAANGISLDFLYKKMWESRSNKSILILDASFNNGGRNIGLRGPSAGKIVPRREVISGNTVVFSAVSENYSSNAYAEMKHGLFTYYFLKGIKDSGGNINIKQLDNLVKVSVSEKAILLGIQQTPITMVSVAVNDIWQEWTIR